MKREIKFRAWDKTSKSMIKDYAHIGMFGELVVTSFHDSAYSDSGCPNLTLLQYTGIKDKKGKEIYEGDVVKYLGWEVRNNRQIRPERIKGIGNETWIADLHSLWCISTGNSMGTVEIVGNIYENTNLINIVKG